MVIILDWRFWFDSGSHRFQYFHKNFASRGCRELSRCLIFLNFPSLSIYLLMYFGEWQISLIKIARGRTGSHGSHGRAPPLTLFFEQLNGISARTSENGMGGGCRHILYQKFMTWWLDDPSLVKGPPLSKGQPPQFIPRFFPTQAYLGQRGGYLPFLLIHTAKTPCHLVVHLAPIDAHLPPPPSTTRGILRHFFAVSEQGALSEAISAASLSAMSLHKRSPRTAAVSMAPPSGGEEEEQVWADRGAEAGGPGRGDVWIIWNYGTDSATEK
jgi:hypothetical protein